MMHFYYLGGILVDSAIHNIDTICNFTGEVPSSVYATGHALDQAYAECDDVDTIVVILNFPSGVKGMIEVNRNANLNHDQRLEARFYLFKQFSLQDIMNNPR